MKKNKGMNFGWVVYVFSKNLLRSQDLWKKFYLGKDPIINVNSLTNNLCYLHKISGFSSRTSYTKFKYRDIASHLALIKRLK